MQHQLPTTPGALLGHTKHGKPIYLIGGGSQPTGEPPASADPPPNPASANQPPADPAPSSTEDISALPDWAQKAIREARAEAAKSRTTAKQNAAEQARQETLAQVAKALGIGQDGEPVDPAELTEQIEQAQAAAFRSSVELGVYRTATALGADPEALLDSNRFIDSLDDLVEQDPRSPEFTQALEAKIREILEQHPSKYKANGQAPAGPPAPRPDPSQGPRGPQPQRFSGSLTDAIKAHYVK